GGEATFVLTSSGHVAGIVNPPGNPKASFWTSGVVPKSTDADAWRASAAQTTGSWWEHWVAWARTRSGKSVLPPKLPAGDPAPGRYVRDEVGPMTQAPNGKRTVVKKSEPVAAVKKITRVPAPKKTVRVGASRKPAKPGTRRKKT
ncbi:MAG TPA: hypothetical protein VID19_10735, partial [Candidatus Eremiobacteraceae bacterium]